jgi:putative transposase
MGYLKGKSALMIFDRHPQMGTKWDRSFWARGYYVTTVGDVDKDAVMKYIADQQEESYKEERAIK